MRSLILFGMSVLIFFSLEASPHDLVDLKKCRPAAVYPGDHIFVHRHVASRLKRVQEDLAKLGIGLIVYEGFRPLSEPSFFDGCCYSKGLGVDVSIYYFTGCDLALPTEYGDDSPLSRRDWIDLPAHVYHNSATLEKYMVKHGFEPSIEKWWHFDLKGWQYCADYEERISFFNCSTNYNDVIYAP